MGLMAYGDSVIASASRNVLHDDTPVIGYGRPRITRMTTRKDRGVVQQPLVGHEKEHAHSSCRVGHGILD